MSPRLCHAYSLLPGVPILRAGMASAVYIVPKSVRKRGGKNSANIGSVEEIADILRFPKWYDT